MFRHMGGSLRPSRLVHQGGGAASLRRPALTGQRNSGQMKPEPPLSLLDVRARPLTGLAA